MLPDNLYDQRRLLEALVKIDFDGVCERWGIYFTQVTTAGCGLRMLLETRRSSSKCLTFNRFVTPVVKVVIYYSLGLPE